MKKVLSILGIVSLFLGNVCFAEETAIATQMVEVEKSGGVFAIQKQPVTSNTTQHIKVSKCGLCIIININGKVKDDVKE